MATDGVSERRPIFSGCAIVALAMVAVAAIIGGSLWFGWKDLNRSLTEGPDPVSIASASLTGMREQNKISAFVANYSAVVTSSQSRFGLSAKKTLIMPGLVRYEVDLSKMDQDDVRWDAETNTLSVRMPPVEVARPQVDLEAIQEYDDGGLLIRLTDAEERLDSANRRKGVAELLRQARGPGPMKLARAAHKRAIEQSFLMPLRAAGIDATVSAFYADEKPAELQRRWDMSRPVSEVLADKRAREAE